MTITFVCETEECMYETRDLLAPELRRLGVKYRTQRGYPQECYQFEYTIPEVCEYEMSFQISLFPDNPRWDIVRKLAQSVADSASEVLRLEIDK